MPAIKFFRISETENALKIPFPLLVSLSCLRPVRPSGIKRAHNRNSAYLPQPFGKQFHLIVASSHAA